ncbi:hypothetical protein OG417_24650 [Actinoallomurus sp. NBC_01490]|uniref:hypothetical protein n=1 Tax=Actinoallomurus sp. NBC_01490 TaxID=2903557 RepID=UPI002E32E452|nr:hypothetical protein [Actinoallomurus sp. NBC_01490]
MTPKITAAGTITRSGGQLTESHIAIVNITKHLKKMFKAATLALLAATITGLPICSSSPSKHCSKRWQPTGLAHAL